MIAITSSLFDVVHNTPILKDTIIYKVLTVPQPSKGFDWIEYLKPSLDFLVALIGAFVLVWKYLTQKQKEFEERIAENKRHAYAQFMENFTETALKVMHDEDTNSILDDRNRLFARDQLLLYANDKVIKSYHLWIEYSDTPDSDINIEVELFGDLLLEIRRDIHGKSTLTKDELSNLNPFNRG